MGGQNVKQIQGESLVQIDHPKFQNAKILKEKGKINIITQMNIDEKEYDKWTEEISILKSDPEYLLMPINHQFTTKGFCGSTGTLTVTFDQYPYLLMEEIENRKKRNSKFQQCELWFLLFCLSAAQVEMKKVFDSKIGDVRPQNIFINQEGQIKISCLYSWPKEGSNFQKSFENQLTLISPQDIKKLQSGGMDDIKNYQAEMFSIGMTILSAAKLCDFGDLYDLKKMKFKYDVANQYLQQWRQNNVYSQIFTAFVSNLCSFQPQKRLSQKQLWSWINKYEEEIKNKDDFFIQHAPIKIEREIQLLRGGVVQGQMMHLPPHQFVHQQQNVPYQQKSVVYPFMQGSTDPRFIVQQGPQLINSRGPVNLPPGVVRPPRQSFSQQSSSKKMIESLHNGIPTAESMYTPIPANMFEQRFGNLQRQGQFGTQINSQLPPGVLPERGIPSKVFGMPTSLQSSHQRTSSSTQQYHPTTMVPPTDGNYVYTRRIIDPTSGGVVAQQRIGEDQYQRGISIIEEPQEADY